MPKFIQDDDIFINIKATKEFTDREEPRKVFWDKYNLVSNNNNQPQVVVYYGFGGIGKSALLHKLSEELKNKAEESKMEFLDFEKLMELNNNLIDILKVVRQDLKEKYNFSFPIFDLVTYVYESKLGKTATKPELNSIFDENKELGFLKDFLSEIPLIGIFSKIIYYTDKGKNLLQERLNNNKLRERLLEIENLSFEQIKTYLAYYFSIDLKENLKKETSPFVFFIDTYEKLVNELTQIGDNLNNDLWLRSDEGLICRVPNVLWIIAGREKLKWQELDEGWEGTLEQHILGTLSFKDTNQFLNTAGIKSEELVHQIYDLTHGNPMYLDMCVDTYVKLIEKGKTPKIEDFGGDTTKLVKRFLMYMNDTERDFSTMLAYISEWTDETIEEISKKLIGTFQFSLYEKVKHFSFIVNENDKYKMNETIKDIIIANTPDTIRTKFLNLLRQNEEEKLLVAINEEKHRINCILKESIEKIPNKKSITFFDTYESKQAYKKLINKLYIDITNETNEKDFNNKVKYIISKYDEYEERFNERIKQISYLGMFSETKYGKLLNIYAEYHTTFTIHELKYYYELKELFGNDSDEPIIALKHALRWDNQTYTDKKILEEIKDIIISKLGKNNLYYIALCGIWSDDSKGMQLEFKRLLKKFSDKNNKFYMMLLIKSSDSTVISAAIAEREKLKSIADVWVDFYKYKDLIDKERNETMTIILNTLKENSELVDINILNSLPRKYIDVYGNNPLLQELFDYIYSLRYIPLNSSDINLIKSFKEIFEYLLDTCPNDTLEDELLYGSHAALYGENAIKCKELLNYIENHLKELYGNT